MRLVFSISPMSKYPLIVMASLQGNSHVITCGERTYVKQSSLDDSRNRFINSLP